MIDKENWEGGGFSASLRQFSRFLQSIAGNLGGVPKKVDGSPGRVIGRKKMRALGEVKSSTFRLEGGFQHGGGAKGVSREEEEILTPSEERKSQVRGKKSIERISGSQNQ